jgi:hypothetical protein
MESELKHTQSHTQSPAARPAISLVETSLNLILIDPILSSVNTTIMHIFANLRNSLRFQSAVLLLVLLTYLLLLPSGLIAQASHNVKTTVQQLAVVSVSSGSVSLAITGAGVVAGMDPMTVTNQATTMSWGANTSTAKIAVKTSLAAQKYTLTVQAININGIPSSAGITAPIVTLTRTSTDFLTGIGLKRGTCSLLYTGIAHAADGVGTDTHTTITFTITN